MKKWESGGSGDGGVGPVLQSWEESEEGVWAGAGYSGNIDHSEAGGAGASTHETPVGRCRFTL